MTLKIIWSIGPTTTVQKKPDMMFSRLPKPQLFDVIFDGEVYPVKARWNKQAKRLILRIDPHNGTLLVTLPRGAKVGEAKRFISSRYSWIQENRHVEHEAPPLRDGSVLLYEGREHVVRFLRSGPRRVELSSTSNEIRVGGPLEHAPRRLVAWLKKQARAVLELEAQGHAVTLGLEFKAIRLGDPKSRWGSCSSRGNLNFSWRLLLAPPEVLSYVAAHEVAHLREMNHSPAFWREVERCCPDWKTHRTWLRKHGGTLLAQARLT